MKLRHTKVATLAATLITFGSLAGGANAALTLSNWNLTSTTLSFDLTGTLDQSFIGPDEKNIIFVGEFGNSSWLNDKGFGNPVVDNGATTATPVDFAYRWTGGGEGDMVYVFNTANWQTGDIFDYTVSYNGSFNVGAVNPSDLGVFWGSQSANYLQPVNLVGSTSSVPEPSSALLLGLGAFGFAARRRRIN